MNKEAFNNIWKMIGLRYKSHPWHGIDIGDKAPEQVTSFIEVIPSDTVKYEVDKTTGYLKIDRPQKFSNIVPALYGFVPQTICRDKVAEYCMEKTGREGIVGDDDPLDICVLTEREVTHGNIIVHAIPIGGFRMIDNGEEDDKIIAVLKSDEVYGRWNDVKDLPITTLELYERLKEKGTLIVPSEYFFPGVDISDYQHAHECIRMSIAADEQTLTDGIRVIGEVVRELYSRTTIKVLQR